MPSYKPHPLIYTGDEFSVCIIFHAVFLHYSYCRLGLFVLVGFLLQAMSVYLCGVFKSHTPQMECAGPLCVNQSLCASVPLGREDLSNRISHCLMGKTHAVTSA